jgi:hypothetical protein
MCALLFATAYSAFVIPPQLVAAQPVWASPADPGALVTGLACYAGGLVALTAWEAFVVPELKLRSILPDVPLVKGQLTVRQVRSPWITPLTADGAIPILDDLHKDDVRVGRRDGVAQYVTLRDLPHRPGAQELSTAWSQLYKRRVMIYKKQRWD